MEKLRALILHPEPLVRDALRKTLGEFDFMRLVGETVSAFEAMELLEAIPYGAIFLGISLPGGVTGLEFAQMLGSRKVKPALIFIAADESQAYKAFELDALDYILWPCPPERLAKTAERLRTFKAAFKEAPLSAAWRESSEEDEDEGEETVKVPLGEEEEDRFMAALRQAWDLKSRTHMPEIEKLPITMDGRLVLVPYDQIIFIEAYEDYSYVHTAGGKYLTSHRLKNLEDRLKPHRFFRVHRKFLVNLDMVTEIASLPGSNFMLRTAGKTRIELPVSRRRINELKQILGL